MRWVALIALATGASQCVTSRAYAIRPYAKPVIGIDVDASQGDPWVAHTAEWPMFHRKRPHRNASITSLHIAITDSVVWGRIGISALNERHDCPMIDDLCHNAITDSVV
jgi:hypothetical protein